MDIAKGLLDNGIHPDPPIRIKLYKMLKSSVIFLKNVVCYKNDSSGAGIVIWQHDRSGGI